MTEAVSNPRHRYEALDALRGVCAICVCLFHFHAAGPIAASSFVQGSWMFVGFFFVLSGFVIAANYRERLIAGGNGRAYVIQRFARIYPLHVFVLAVFVAMELVGLFAHGAGVMQRPAFEGSHSIGAIFTNLALLQAFGLHPTLTWNAPSWSIAVEFWTYLLFALAARLAGPNLEKWLVAAALAAVAVLAVATDRGTNVSHDWSMFRCIYGFSVGAIAWRLWSRSEGSPGPAGPLFTLVEIAAFVLIFAYVGHFSAAPTNLVSPIVFAGVLLTFAFEGGAISQLLRSGPMLWLGNLSYSIYMVHIFVQARLEDVLRLVQKHLHIELISYGTTPTGRPVELLGSNPVQGVVLTVIMLGLVVATAALTRRFIELPGMRWGRRLAAQYSTSAIENRASRQDPPLSIKEGVGSITRE